MSLKYSLKLKVLVAQLHLALYNSMYCILLSSSVQGILQTECWSELPFSSPGDPPDPGIKPRSPARQADSLQSEQPGKPQAAAPAKSLQSCPTLCNPIDGSLPGSPVPGILQARTLEWVAISFSNARK